MKNIFLLIASGAFLGLAGCGGGRSGEASGEIAKYNGKPITTAEYLKALETLQAVQVQYQNGQVGTARVAQPLSSQAFAKAIEKQVILQSAQDESVLPSNADIDQELALRKELSGQYVDAMKQQGFSLDDIRELIKVDLATYNLQTRGIKQKTLKDAEAYVKANPKAFEQPATATMRWIVVDTPAEKAAVDKDLASNMTFGAVAGSRSKVDGAKAANGAFNSGGGPVPRPVSLPSLPPAMSQAAASTEVGKISDWFKVDKKWIRIFVEAKSPARPVQPTKAQLEQVRRSLTLQDAKGTNDLRTLFVNKLKDAKIEIRPSYLKKNWETFMTALKQQMPGVAMPPASSTPPPPTPKKPPK